MARLDMQTVLKLARSMQHLRERCGQAKNAGQDHVTVSTDHLENVIKILFGFDVQILNRRK